MIIRAGFIKHEKNKDDIYITPCLAMGLSEKDRWARSANKL